MKVVLGSPSLIVLMVSGYKATLILPLPPPPNRDQNIQKVENNACMLIRHCKTCAEFEGKPFSFFKQQRGRIYADE